MTIKSLSYIPHLVSQLMRQSGENLAKQSVCVMNIRHVRTRLRDTKALVELNHECQRNERLQV